MQFLRYKLLNPNLNTYFYDFLLFNLLGEYINLNVFNFAKPKYVLYGCFVRVYFYYKINSLSYFKSRLIHISLHSVMYGITGRSSKFYSKWTRYYKSFMRI